METKNTNNRTSYKNISKRITFAASTLLLASTAIVATPGSSEAAVLPMNTSQDIESSFVFDSCSANELSLLSDFSQVEEKSSYRVYSSEKQLEEAHMKAMHELVGMEAERTGAYIDELESVNRMVDSILDEVQISMESMKHHVDTSNKAIAKAEKEEKERKAKEEEEKRKKAVLTYKNGYGDITQNEFDVLCRIVEAEAGNQSLVGRILVANVIFNRVESRKFPNNIVDVVLQSGQFEPVSNGRFYDITVSERTKEAVRSAISGEDYSSGALYFTAFYDPYSWFGTSLTLLFQEGDHYFYK